MVPICLVPLVPVSKSDFGCRGPLFGGRADFEKSQTPNQFVLFPPTRPRRRACCRNRQPSRAWLIQLQREYAMAKRKLSTFERLQRGERLNRKQRREVQQRLNLDDPGLDIIHRDAAGIDVGNESHLYRYLPTATRSPYASSVRGPPRLKKWRGGSRIVESAPS